MDIIVVKKLLAHLAYPSGLIACCIVLMLFYQVLGKKARSGLFAALGIIIFLISSNPIFSNSLVSRLENRHPQPELSTTPTADAIIVLGGNLRLPAYPRRFSQLTNKSDRFWYAAKLFKAGKANQIILSGGNVYQQFSLEPEAFYIKQILVDLGIPETAIIIEGDSRTTEQNAEQTLAMLRERELKSVLLVTSALHMPRSLSLFDNDHTTIHPASADILVADTYQPSIFNWLPSAGALSMTTAALHEYYGMWFDKAQKQSTIWYERYIKPLLKRSPSDRASAPVSTEANR